jgi:hypothetical protein
MYFLYISGKGYCKPERVDIYGKISESDYTKLIFINQFGIKSSFCKV